MSRTIRGVRDWQTLGVTLKVELSTAGSLVLGTNVQNLPLDSGGVGGVPVGWTQESYQAPNNFANINFTTASGVFSASAKAPMAANDQSHYGMRSMAMPVVPGKRYRLQIQTRTMASFPATTRRIYLGTASGSQIFGAYNMATGTTDWEMLELTTTPVAAGVTQAYIYVLYGTSPSGTTGVTFGGQCQNINWFTLDRDPEPIVWKDITCDVQNIAVRYGRERYTSRYDVSNLSVQLRNEDGQYTYRDPHPLNLRPGRLLRVTATHEGITYPIAYHVIDAINDRMDMDGTVVTVMTALDTTSILSNKTTPSITENKYKSGGRIKLLLDSIGYTLSTLDAGQFTQIGITENGRSMRDEMGIGADSEGGAVYAERDGVIRYRDRTWPTYDDNLKSVTANLEAKPDLDYVQVIPDDVPTQPGAPNVCLREVVTDWSMARVINSVELANVGGTAKTYEVAESIKANGPRTYQRLDFINYPANYTGLDERANDYLTNNGTPNLRLNTVRFRPDISPEAWPWTLSVFLNWLVRVWYQNIQEKWGWAIVTHVQSVEHLISPKEWQTTLAVDLPISYVDAPIYEIGIDDWQGGHWQVSHWRNARFTELARFNKSRFERAAALFDTAKFDLDRFQ